MRKKSVLLGFAAAGTIASSTLTATLPANAAPVTSSPVSSNSPAGSISPAGIGKTLCNGDLCIQRVTTVEDGTAYVEAWAYTSNFKGHFALYGPNGHISDSKTKSWDAGGPGQLFLIPAGGGYYIEAWQGTAPPYRNIGTVNFSV